MKIKDNDILCMILNLEKNMSNNYSVLMSEASNEFLYEDYFDMFTSVKDISRDIYEYLYQEGFYKIDEEKETSINKALKEFTKKIDELDS